MPQNFLEPDRRPQPVWKRASRAIRIWLRELIYSVLEVMILFTVTSVLVGILLSSLEALWYLYLQTPVGIKYTANPTRLSPHLLTQLFSQDLFLFSVEVAVAALTACLAISTAFQILALRRYFYVGRGMLNRIVVLVLFSAAAGFKLAHAGSIDLPVAIGVSIIPSLCLFPSCMNISARILPEVTPRKIIKLFINVKNFIFHSGDRDMPHPQAALSELRSGTPQPPSALKPTPLLKNRGTGSVKTNAGVTIR